MKILIGLLLGSCLMPVSLLAQDIQQIGEMIYYERYNSALNNLHNRLKADPSNAEAWYWLSQAYLELDKSTGLKDTLQKVPAEIITNPAYKVIKGQLLLKEKNIDSAQFYFTQALKSTKEKDVFILSAIARAHINELPGNAAYAEELLKKAIKRDKKNEELYILMGDAYRKLDNGGAAFQMYQSALNTNSNYAAASYKLGKIFVSQKNTLYLTYFNQAIKADPKYAPAYYDLYYHYYFTDPSNALRYLDKYITNSDYNLYNEYLYADLLYLNKNYQQAINKTRQLLAESNLDTLPRLYKLMAFSYAGLKDTSTAIHYLNEFFSKKADSTIIAKDYELIADLYASQPEKKDSAILFYKKAVEVNQDTTKNYAYYRKLADLNKDLGNYSVRADWLARYYENNARASNLDLFNWGIAHFRAEEYSQADTVFALYTEKYPEQSFGYYWRARSNALLDSGMQTGSAIPHYKQLISLIEKDTSVQTNKKWLIEAYGYIAAYESNTEKNYENAIEYLEKVLELDPANKDAQHYIEILGKTVQAEQSK